MRVDGPLRRRVARRRGRAGRQRDQRQHVHAPGMSRVGGEHLAIGLLRPAAGRPHCGSATAALKMSAVSAMAIVKINGEANWVEPEPSACSVHQVATSAGRPSSRLRVKPAKSNSGEAAIRGRSSPRSAARPARSLGPADGNLDVLRRPSRRSTISSPTLASTLPPKREAYVCPCEHHHRHAHPDRSRRSSCAR